MKVNNNSDRNQANLYTNYELYLERSALKTNTDEYYHLDLIGLKVYDTNNKFIGVIDEINNNNDLDFLKINTTIILIVPFTKNVNKIELKLKKLFLYQK